DDRPTSILDTEDNDPAGAVIRHTAHPHGNINRACGATLELDRRRLTAGDQFAQSLFGHDDAHGYGGTAMDTYDSTGVCQLASGLRSGANYSLWYHLHYSNAN